MKITHRKLATLAVFVSVAASFNPVFATGLPVLDVANLGQAMQQVAAWQQQYSQMQNQISSMTGDRGMANLLPGNRTYLPSDWNSAMNTLNQGAGTSYGGLAQAAQQIKNAQSVLSQQQTSTMTPQMQQYVEKIRNLSASQQAMGQAAYTTAAQRVNTLQTLTNSLNGQTDPKAVMDLQARIQSEQAGLANDQAQLQSVAQLTAAQGQAQKVMANELRAQTSGSGNFPRTDTSVAH
ncbi:type IV secretion system protein [Glaciimonas sp. GNP009]